MCVFEQHTLSLSTPTITTESCKRTLEVLLVIRCAVVGHIIFNARIEAASAGWRRCLQERSSRSRQRETESYEFSAIRRRLRAISRGTWRARAADKSSKTTAKYTWQHVMTALREVHELWRH